MEMKYLMVYTENKANMSGTKAVCTQLLLRLEIRPLVLSCKYTLHTSEQMMRYRASEVNFMCLMIYPKSNCFLQSLKQKKKTGTSKHEHRVQ